MSQPTTTAPPTGRHRVVIIGSGFGGLFSARALKHADVDIVLISSTSHHLFQPLLYQVATGILSEGVIAPSIREVLARQRNVTCLFGHVDAIDLATRTITARTLDSTQEYSYDSLIVAAGAGQSYFGNDHFARYAPGMKSIDDALELRGRIFGSFELAELAASSGREQDLSRLMTFVVVGAGPTGVEMAGQIAELSKRTLKHDFRRINSKEAHVVLVDAADQVLPAFGTHLGGRAEARLKQMGVEVQLGAKVVDVDNDGIVIEDKDGQRRRIEALCKVWAAGVQASPLGAQLAEQSGAGIDRSGRVEVEPDLTLPGHPEVFVVGDMISLDNLPGVAQNAIQGGRFAARQIIRRLKGEPTQPAFHYKDKGSMATISRFSAVASIGKAQLSGFIAWLMWLGVHLVYIIGFKSQITTLLHWAVSFLGRGRGERTSTEQQIYARVAIEKLGDRFTPRSGLSPTPPSDQSAVPAPEQERHLSAG
ncbi:NAD(P)/FAD-dependent oxidoreductase [Calidifontibacter sp. DB0510]|uniref:NADH:ubiquinone reductase (non-electrogenic) n=1 Tax=Metallococcus carri TaxID=1656884 RepID=A0A967B1U0_9MICO|nr:NAD(P)/FAD-dependent oxidoreductase [Metallococcus carri]NHN56439.1 NAD(P)/FAD-dependent oxidoreductase [Metallococcus carri]NOP36063.1 NAD(P)/FAD-dependent oxidoreductase [Calidifontibacter sp. DB2511S]